MRRLAFNPGGREQVVADHEDGLQDDAPVAQRSHAACVAAVRPHPRRHLHRAIGNDTNAEGNAARPAVQLAASAGHVRTTLVRLDPNRQTHFRKLFDSLYPEVLHRDIQRRQYGWTHFLIFHR